MFALLTSECISKLASFPQKETHTKTACIIIKAVAFLTQLFKTDSFTH